MECKEIKNKLQELIDNSLNDQDVRTVKNHLGVCRSCTDDYRLLNLVAGSVKSLSFPKLGQDFNASIFKALSLEYKVPKINPVIKWATGAVLSLSSVWLTIFGLGVIFGLNRMDPFKVFTFAKDLIKALPNLQVILVKFGLRLADTLDLLGQVATTLLRGSSLPIQIAIASVIAFAIIAATSRRIYVNSKI
jgi:predicted anti-sigma-YlaC factor YlaD